MFMFGYVNQLLLIIVTLSACRTEKDVFLLDSGKTVIVDSDQDGFALDLDCDDTNPPLIPRLMRL